LNRLTPLDYAIVGAFLIGMLAMGARFARGSRSREEYFLGGRRMPWAAVGISTLATLMSTITFLAVPGEIIRNGTGYLSGLVAVPFMLAFSLVIALPFLLRLRVTSAYEYLERRFDRPTRLTGSGLFAAMSLGWMATVVYTASLAVAEISGFPLYGVICVVGLVGVAYTALGGIRATIWTDVVQAGLMFGGALFTLGFVAHVTGTGPARWWTDAAQVQADPVPLFTLDPFVRVSMLGVALNNFFWHACQMTSSQIAVQRFLATPDVRAARRAANVNAVANLGLTLLLALCGLALFSYYTGQPGLLGDALDPASGAGADRLFPHFIASELPPAAAGLLVAALLAAAMSTLDSGVNSFSAVATTDWFPRKASADKEGEVLGRARLLTVGVGGLVILFAVGIHLLKGASNTLFDILPAAFNWGVGPLGGLFFAGMFLRRCTGRSVRPAVLIGAAVGLVTALLKPLWGIPFTFAWVIPYSCGATVLVAWLLSLREKRPTQQHLVWSEVVRRRET
jgi:solute:Na+ symporter, SSS family